MQGAGQCWELGDARAPWCCSTLALLLHPSAAGARNGCRSLLPACPAAVLPGELQCRRPRLVPQSGQGEGRRCPLVRSCPCSPLLLCPRILSQKWGKNPALPGGCPTSAGGRAPESRGKWAKTSPEPKKTRNPPNRGDFWKSTTCFGRSPAHHIHGCGVVRQRTPPCKLGPPHECWGSLKPPRGCFSFLLSCGERSGGAGLGSTHRGGESSFPLGPSPDVPLV